MPNDGTRNITGRDDLHELVERTKRLATSDDRQDPEPATIGELARRLLACDPNLGDALQNDREGAIACIRLLSRVGHREAVFALLAHLDISRDDSALLEAAIGLGMDGDPVRTHQWIADYDIVGQRLEMIRAVVLPYVAAHCPQKTLFRALKEYEAEGLARNRPLLDAAALHRVIGASRTGVPAAVATDTHASRAGHAASVRLVLPNETFSVLLRLAWIAPEYVFDLHERHQPEELLELLRTLGNVVPVYLIPTHLGYPMGGGESFLHQTCRILSEFGVKCVWASFLDPKAGWYTRDSLTYTPYYIDVRYAGGCSTEAIRRAVDRFNPDLIHAQGGTSDAAMEIAVDTRLTTLVGYHFWNGLVELGETGNRHIIENLALHRLRPPPFPQSSLIRKYVASEFMREVHARLGGTEDLEVIHPISDAAQFLASREGCGTFVLQVNVCSLKGGNIFFDSVRALGDEIPFMGIQSEPESSDFAARLADEMARHSRCVLKSYGNVREFYRTARMVIVPTLVDETFCRVAFEAAMNGIPVLSTANGYLPQMLGETGVFLPENSADWITAIRDLYHDTERLSRIGDAQRARLQGMFGSDFHGFIQPAMELIDNSATRNIGMFTVWGDQGIGNLAHAHAKLLRSAGYRVHIFSFQPYAAIGKALVRQSNFEDWSVPANADSVYYSFNDRESVSVNELTQFILANNIHTLLVPEICWQPNWERLFALRVSKLAICNIPMIEIVIRDEIPNHNRLTSTLYCTHLAERVLDEAGVVNGAFLGHGFGRPLPHGRIEAKRQRLAQRPKIRFLHVAGHNPKTRKNTPQVISAFAKALEARGDIELTVTAMDPASTFYAGEIPAGITIIDRSLSREEVLDLYEQHDVSIQVSSHEGLGLGFYESISRCTPVVSLDAPPHNEIVLEGETGWLIPAHAIPMPDNDRSVLSAWRFDTATLTRRIVSLERDEIDRLIIRTEEVYKTRFDEVALLTRFLQTLPRQSLALPPPAAVRVESVPESPSFLAPEAVQPATRNTGLKVLVKRALYLLARRAYHLAKPVTRRVAQRLRLLMIESGADLRQQMHFHGDALAEHRQQLRSLTRANESLHQKVQAISESVVEMHHEIRGLAKTLTERSDEGTRAAREALAAHREDARLLRTTIGGLHQELQAVTRTAPAMERRIDDVADRVQECVKALALVRREARFIKNRLASYAGPETVLTYLRDESPIFVNTGDLGCPSPIVDGGVWEPDNLDVLYSFVAGDSIFVDVGANVGYFSIAIGNRLGRGGKVHAIEPHPRLSSLIARSIQLNSLESVVKVWPLAASDRNGALDLFYPDGHLGRGSAAHNLDEPGQTLSVQAGQLDELLPRDIVVDLVKIDVEGHELAVLQGMKGILSRSTRVKVLFEKLEADTADTNAIGDLLADLGLACFGVGPHAVLVPLDSDGYRAWVGDVLAAPKDAVDRLRRAFFSVYPGQLIGEGLTEGAVTRYRPTRAGIVFFGPGWYLREGTWRVRFLGRVSGVVRLLVVEDQVAVLAELHLSEKVLEASFTAGHDVARFEMRAHVDAGAEVDLERMEFERI